MLRRGCRVSLDGSFWEDEVWAGAVSKVLKEVDGKVWTGRCDVGGFGDFEYWCSGILLRCLC